MASGDSLDLFSPDDPPAPPSAGPARGIPLAERLRPRVLDDVVGQDHLLGPDGPLRGWIAAGRLPSCVLWGPPGVGKTTLARLLAEAAGAQFAPVSGVEVGVKEMRAVIADADRGRRTGQRTVLFVDEIHRLNRAQQDALLPHVEAGRVTLIGATTENPSFEVIGPLLSRARVFTLKRLDRKDLERIVDRALADSERGLGADPPEVAGATRAAIAEAADGDARRALGLLETAADLARSRAKGDAGRIDAELLQQAAGKRLLFHDRDREEHYNVVSALIKSLRASDPDAALYYLARMLDAGEDPLFIARRLVIFASEDVGNADLRALPLATSTFLAVERVGLPEGRIPLAQATSFLACAPKSNAAYAALGRAQRAVSETGSLPVPLHLRNAPTALMKREGYGRDYVYAHDREDAFVEASNLPPELADRRFYEPTERGDEAALSERLGALRSRRDTREP